MSGNPNLIPVLRPSELELTGAFSRPVEAVTKGSLELIRYASVLEGVYRKRWKAYLSFL